MASVDVALATANGVGDNDRDAAPLRAALRRRGVAAHDVVWNDAAVDWSRFALTVLRSTWDYPEQHSGFLRWTRHVNRAGRLCNDADIVAWNTHKRYLLALAEADVPVVPTTVVPPGGTLALPADRAFVIKPAVSAGSRDTARFDPEQHDGARAHAERLHAAGRDVLVQPYLADVDDRGETALIFVDGRYSHAIRKGPMLTGTRRMIAGLYLEEDIAAREPTDAEIAVADAALAAVPTDRAPLYARVDVLPAEPDPLVLEVELVEPSLFLAFDGGAADRLAAAIVGRL